jgi:hypothetical protein
MDKDERLFLAVAAYGAVDVQLLATASSRALLLQYLPSLYSTQGLQPFFIKDQRIHLPSNSKASGLRFDPLELYNKLSVLKATGGHPRKMETLFRAFNSFSFSEKVVNSDAGVRFAKALSNWLKDNEEMIDEQVDAIAQFPSTMLGLSENDLPNAIEQLAAACAFDMTGSQDDAKRHMYTLKGTTTGHCSLVNVGRKILTFIPPAVLRLVPDHDFAL